MVLKNCWRFVFIGLTGLRNEATLKNTNNAQDNAEPLCGHVLMDFSLRVFLLSQIFLCQLVLFNIEQQLISASHTCLKVWKAALYDEPGGNFSTLLQRKETGGKKLWGKEWGKVKPKFGKKISIPLFPVSSDTGAFQGSFTNNYTMFFFPLIDYISTLRSIPFKCKQLQHLTKLGPWLS